MKTEQIQFSANQLILSVKRPSHFITIFMLSAASLCIIVPLIYLLNLIFQVSNGIPIQTFALVFVLILILFGLYLLKAFIWNFEGNEVYQFDENEVIVFSDYRFFKSDKKKFSRKNLKFESENSGYENGKKSVLILKSGNERYKSKVELNENELDQLIEKLSQNYIS